MSTKFWAHNRLSALSKSVCQTDLAAKIKSFIHIFRQTFRQTFCGLSFKTLRNAFSRFWASTIWVVTMKTKSIRVCSYYFSVQTYFNILQRMDYKYFNKSHFINICAFPRNTCLITARLMWYEIPYITWCKSWQITKILNQQ